MIRISDKELKRLLNAGLYCDGKKAKQIRDTIYKTYNVLIDEFTNGMFRVRIKPRECK